MKESDRLYRELLRDPHDETLRWAYRDALDEEDDPYAEWLRRGLDADFPPGHVPAYAVRHRDRLVWLSLGVAVPGWTLGVRGGLVREIVTTCNEYCVPQRLKTAFESYPLTRVVLRDRIPGGGILKLAYWTRPVESVWVSGFPNMLPLELWDRLPRGIGALRATRQRYYPSREAADAALSEACLQLGRWVAHES